ncbi:MAG TPA: D-aminoacyl-tRNA deacylase [Steroidobacteraceae bacterium]|nr:D-aminoacyl-tRNA deacylase [Steroidobacteraceae bacterium]
MISLIQRVSEASVTVDGERVGWIGHGLLALVAVEPGDTEATARRLVDRMIAYRVFDDANGRMNRSVADVGGQLLMVSQFTLAADTRKGLRPSFSSAADPALGRELFERAVEYARATLPGKVAAGRFGAHMQVALVNDGPVTFWLQIPTPGATE